MSLCLKYLILLREATRPFWIAKHTPSSLERERESVCVSELGVSFTKR